MMFRKLSALVGLLLVGLFLCGFAGPAQGTEETTGTPWWVWVLIILRCCSPRCFGGYGGIVGERKRHSLRPNQGGSLLYRCLT